MKNVVQRKSAGFLLIKCFYRTVSYMAAAFEYISCLVFYFQIVALAWKIR